MTPDKLRQAFSTNAKMGRALIGAMPGLTKEEIASGIAAMAAFCEAFAAVLGDLPSSERDTELVLE